MNLCQYKDIFGKPGEGVHAIRFMNIAMVDVVATIFGAYLISLFTKWNFLAIFITLFVLGFILHVMFCVDTTLVKLVLGK